MKLFEIVKERSDAQKRLSIMIAEHEKAKSKLESSIWELRALESIGKEGLDLDKVQLAETLLRVEGDPYGETSSKYGTIAEAAIIDIAEGCQHLKTKYFGNKEYSGYYQREDHKYGYGPRHGSIVDRIGLVNSSYELSDNEKDACIYYLKNYNKIKNAKEEIK